ncbi:MAG: hypothetical protein ACTSX9_00610 [Candidatus Njordarchaeales archaeon]
MKKFFLQIFFREQGSRGTLLYKVFSYDRDLLAEGLYPVGLDNISYNYTPNYLEWIHIVKTPFINPAGGCGATSYNKCKRCPLGSQEDLTVCGRALVYLRPFPHKRGKFLIKVGVGADLLRPSSQSSPFAIISTDITRRKALFLEESLSNIFNFVVRNPRGRLLWSDIIARGLWNGFEEASYLLEILPQMYDKVRNNYPAIYALLTDPVIFMPTKHFSSPLPTWIEKLPIRDIRKYVIREPNAIYGEVVANRGGLLVIEHEDGFWIFEPNERRIYALEKIVGLQGESTISHFVKRKMILKE